MRTSQKIMLTAAFIFFAAINAYGQEVLSTQREREIKVSGKYYFAECTAFDEAVAKDCALRDLTQKVITALVQQSIRSEEEMKKVVEMRANMAHLPMIGRVQILAWVAKDSIFIMQENDTKPEANPEKAAPEKVEPEKVEPEKIEPEKIEPEKIEPEKVEPEKEVDRSSKPAIVNPIIQDLSTSETLTQFERKADGYARQGKLLYSGRKTAFTRPDNCHIAIFSSSRTLIAILDKGNASRTNLMTGETIKNPEQHYSGNQIIWIQIN